MSDGRYTQMSSYVWWGSTSRVTHDAAWHMLGSSKPSRASCCILSSTDGRTIERTVRSLEYTQNNSLPCYDNALATKPLPYLYRRHRYVCRVFLVSIPSGYGTALHGSALRALNLRKGELVVYPREVTMHPVSSRLSGMDVVHVSV